MLLSRQAVLAKHGHLLLSTAAARGIRPPPPPPLRNKMTSASQNNPDLTIFPSHTSSHSYVLYKLPQRKQIHLTQLPLSSFVSHVDSHCRNTSRHLHLPTSSPYFSTFPVSYSTSSASFSTSLTSSSPSSNYTVIYKFPYIAIAKAFCRLKLYQTAMTCLAVPVVAHLVQLGMVEQSLLIYTIAVNVLAMVMLGVMGEGFRKLVGHIYLSDDRTTVKISHLTFFGKRYDIEVPALDLVPLDELPDSTTDLYVRTKRYSDAKEGSNLILCLRFGGVEDVDRFRSVFGTVV